MIREKHRQEPSFVKNLYYYFSEYCSNTSIHGLKFLGEKKRSVCERIWWLIFLVISLYFCVTSIIKAYHKWELSPVVVSFATSETPIWRVPFPAVTICPQVKAHKNIVNFTDLVLLRRNGQELNDEQTMQLDYMSLICSKKWRSLDEALSGNIISEEVIDFLVKVQPRFDDTVEECYWSGKTCTEDTNKIFTPILTKEGICFSFNLLDRSEIFTDQVAMDYYKNYSVPHQPPSQWSLEKGYFENQGVDTIPRRAVVGGASGGLDLTLWLESADLDYICADALQGYKVILHNPAQVPYVKQRFFRVGLNQDVTASVKPIIMTTSERLKHYTPKQRKCFFEEEKKLKFFRFYDQQNCLHECLANFTYNYCGCVGFFMLRDRSMPICGPGKHDCMDEASSMFQAEEVAFRIKYQHGKRIQRNSTTRKRQKNCNCFPNCNSLNYEAEISQSQWDWQERAKLLATYNHELPGMYGISQNIAPKVQSYCSSNEYSRLQVFFKDMQFITSERNELYGEMDFLASCGGLLGLFIGFSFISLVEIVYFVSLRFVCNIRKYGSQYWSGDNELLTVKVDV